MQIHLNSRYVHILFSSTHNYFYIYSTMFFILGYIVFILQIIPGARPFSRTVITICAFMCFLNLSYHYSTTVSDFHCRICKMRSLASPACIVEKKNLLSPVKAATQSNSDLVDVGSIRGNGKGRPPHTPLLRKTKLSPLTSRRCHLRLWRKRRR